MWKSVALFRDRDRLADAVQQLDSQEAAVEEALQGNHSLDHAGWRRANIITVASLIAKAALRRRESRGCHFRTDYPAHDDLNWKLHISDVIQRT